MEMSRSKAVLRVIFLAVAMLGQLASTVRAQDEVRLLQSADVGSGKVLLRDVAELKGLAESLGEVVVLESWPAESAGSSWTTLELATVKAAIGKSPHVNWGKLSLNGSTCTVRRPQAAKPGETLAAAAKPAPAEPARTPDGSRVRDLIPARIAQILNVDVSKLRVTFDEAQATLLDTATAGRSVELLHGGLTEKMPLTVRVYEKDRVVAAGSARVQVQVKRDCLIVKTGRKRGDLVELSEVGIESRWMSPAVPAATVEDFGSAIKSGQVKAGQMILKSDIEPPVVIKKGDAVQVSCVSGTIVLKMIARAAQDGRVDEIITFETVENKKKRTFTARVAGAGRAVTTAAGSEAGATANEAAEAAVELETKIAPEAKEIAR